MKNWKRPEAKQGRVRRAGNAKSILIAVLMATGFGFPGANALAQTVNVNCPGQSIQGILNLAPAAVKGLTLNINGTCTENVLIKLNNVTLNGLASATVNGTITVDGAKRVIVQNLRVTGTGDGVVVTRNGSATVQNSVIRFNDDNGIFVTHGAQADILNNLIRKNGQNVSGPDLGYGIQVNHGGNVNASNNSINDNLSYGVGVLDGATALLESNTIMRNGRLEFFETGVGVYRARVRANGNTYLDNAYAAIEVYNDAGYRTGKSLGSGGGGDDNPFGFENITAGTGQIAISMGRSSYVDLRQVIVQGTIEMGSDSMLLVRGDDIEPNTQCSEVDDITAFAVNSSIELNKYTRVNGVITFDPNQGNRVASNSGCPLP